MTALPVAYYLKELSGEPSRRGRGAGAFGSEEASDIDFQIKEAHQRGLVEGRAAAQAEHEAAVAALAASFEEKLAAERQKWAAEQGAHLGERIAASIEDLEQRIADAVSEILKPVLREEVRVKAVEELSRTLETLLSKGDYAKIVVSGPADLIAAMEARLAGDDASLSFVAAEGADINVSADETILATRIGAWADAIAGTTP